MNTHPTQDELVSLLYGELAAPRITEVRSHVAACSECRAAHDELRRTMTALDAWRVATRVREEQPFGFPALRWAAAAAVVLGVGFGLGHFTAPRADEAAMRVVFQSETAHVARAYESKLDEDRAAIVDILKTMKAQHDTEYSALRRALETVAVNAEDGLRSAAFQIGELATIAQPAANPGTAPQR